MGIVDILFTTLLIAVIAILGLKIIKMINKEGFQGTVTVPSNTPPAPVKAAACSSLSPVAAAAAKAAEASSDLAKAKAAEIAKATSQVVSDNLVDSENESGMNVSCPSGEKPTVSFMRNTKNAKPQSKDVNTLKDVKGVNSTDECSAASTGTGGGYNFDPSKEY